jgi:DNA-directed RNA polymerase subunit L
MQYDINSPDYTNLNIKITIKDEDTLEDFRKQIEYIYEIPAASYLITYVSD